MSPPSHLSNAPLDEPSAARWIVVLPWLIALGGLLLRVAEQAWLGGYELAADEAQYWDWSRRLDWSYYTKGPGIAWAIGASTHLLGDSAWAVRLPGLLAWSGTVLVGAALARTALRPRPEVPLAARQKAGAFAATLIALTPAFFAAGQFATIDMPYIFCWAVAAWLGLLAITESAVSKQGPTQSPTQSPTRGEGKGIGRRMALWIALGAVLGIGFLFKYTAALLLPGLLVATLLFWLRETRNAPHEPAKERNRVGRRLVFGWLMMLAAFVLAAMPVVIWNYRLGWPTVAHLLGHLHAEGGDTVVSEARPWTPLWLLEYLGTQFGILGPGLWIMVGWATWRTLRHAQAAPDPVDSRGASPVESLEESRSEFPVSSSRHDRDDLRPDPWSVWALWWMGMTPLAFYVLVALRTDAEANWPIAGYATLVPMVAAWSPWGIDDWRARIAAWRELPEPRPKRGVLRRMPETAWQVGWHWALGWGLVAALGIGLAPHLISALPTEQRDRLTRRIAGHSDRAAAIEARISELPEATREQLAWTSDRYGEAALLAFYLPSRPSVHSVESLTPTGRESSYDYFADTNLWRHELMGGAMVCVGGDRAKWERLLEFETLTVLDPDLRLFLVESYQGPRAEAPADRLYAPGISR